MNPTQSDLPIQRILAATTWRARFFEAAANASASVVKYSIERQDSIATALWFDRMHFFRRKAALSGQIHALEQTS